MTVFRRILSAQFSHALFIINESDPVAMSLARSGCI